MGPLGDGKLRELDLCDDIRDGESAAGSSDIRVSQPIRDLFGSKQHTDGDRRVGRQLQVVYGQLRRNAGRNGSIHNRQPDFDHHVLRPLGNGKLRQLDLRDDNSDGQSAAGSADISIGKPGRDLLGIEQHTDGGRRVRRYLRKWYTGSCGGTLVGTGTSISVSPTSTTTYYVRWETASCGSSTCATTTVMVNAPLVVNGFATGSLTQGSTLGGAEVVFEGANFVPGMSVWFEAEHDSVQGQVLAVEENGTRVRVRVPAIAPGCDSGTNSGSFPANVVFEACGQTVNLAGAGQHFTYQIHRTEVTNPNGLYTAVSAAQPGTCIRLRTSVGNYNVLSGTLPIGSGKQRIALTSYDPTNQHRIPSPGETMVRGYNRTYPTITFDGHGPGVCVSNVNIILGNTGVMVKNGAAPTLVNCKIDDNGNSGGVVVEDTRAVEISPRAHLTITDSVVTLNIGSGIRVTNASATVSRCWITCNNGSNGGGISVDIGDGYSGEIAVTDCNIQDNAASGNGGGIYLNTSPTANVLITGCTIAHNDHLCFPPSPHLAQNGGGVYWTSAVPGAGGRLVGNLIESNSVTGNGAGVYIGMDVEPTVSCNTIRDNAGTSTASWGGGIYVAQWNRSSNPISHNVIVGNSAQVGGGVALMEKCRARVENNLVLCNHAVNNIFPQPSSYYAAGIYVKDAYPQIRHNTIYQNTGTSRVDSSGGIHGDILGTGNPVFSDNILLDNDGRQMWLQFTYPSQSWQIDYNIAYDPDQPAATVPQLIYVGQGTAPVPHNLAANPLLYNPSCSPGDPWMDFSPQPGSPAIGTASEQGLNRGVVFNDRNGNGQPDECELGQLLTIRAAKQAADGTLVRAEGSIVSAAFGGFFYVESDDRISGMRVESAGHILTEGMRADIAGALSTNSNGERFIQADSAVQSAPPYDTGHVDPLILSNRAFGGTDFHYVPGPVWPATVSGQKGITGGVGLNNIGLLVTAFGRVTEVDAAVPATWFKMDDGSGVGVKVALPSGVAPPAMGSYVRGTGACSCEKVGNDILPLLRMRTVSGTPDFAVLAEP